MSSQPEFLMTGPDEKPERSSDDDPARAREEETEGRTLPHVFPGAQRGELGLPQGEEQQRPMHDEGPYDEFANVAVEPNPANFKLVTAGE